MLPCRHLPRSTEGVLQGLGGHLAQSLRQGLIHDFLEAGLRLSAQPLRSGRHVVIQGQRHPHAPKHIMHDAGISILSRTAAAADFEAQVRFSKPDPGCPNASQAKAGNSPAGPRRRLPSLQPRTWQTRGREIPGNRILPNAGRRPANNPCPRDPWQRAFRPLSPADRRHRTGTHPGQFPGSISRSGHRLPYGQYSLSPPPLCGNPRRR